MTRNPRELYSLALDALLRGRMASVVQDRDWELLIEVARLAHDDAPPMLAVTDPFLYRGWRAAVTRYHVAGWGSMTPDRVRQVRDGNRAASVRRP